MSVKKPSPPQPPVEFPTDPENFYVEYYVSLTIAMVSRFNFNAEQREAVEQDTLRYLQTKIAPAYRKEFGNFLQYLKIYGAFYIAKRQEAIKAGHDFDEESTLLEPREWVDLSKRSKVSNQAYFAKMFLEGAKLPVEDTMQVIGGIDDEESLNALITEFNAHSC